MLCVCERVTDLWAVFQVAATARMASLQVSLFRRRSFWHKLPKLTISHQSARRGLALSQLSVLARNTCGLLPERAPSTADQVPPPLPPPPRRLRLPDATVSQTATTAGTTQARALVCRLASRKHSPMSLVFFPSLRPGLLPALPEEPATP